MNKFLELREFLNNELKSLETFLADEYINDQFYRRLFLRQVFLIIESNLHFVKEIIQFNITKNPSLLNTKVSTSDLMILYGKSYSIRDSGTVQARDAIYPFNAHLKFTLKTYAKVFNSDMPDFEKKEAKKLFELARRRNDLTHPKDINKQIISNSELKDLIGSLQWFIETQGNITKKVRFN